MLMLTHDRLSMFTAGMSILKNLRFELLAEKRKITESRLDNMITSLQFGNCLNDFRESLQGHLFPVGTSQLTNVFTRWDMWWNSGYTIHLSLQNIVCYLNAWIVLSIPIHTRHIQCKPLHLLVHQHHTMWRAQRYRSTIWLTKYTLKALNIVRRGRNIYMIG